MTMYTSEGKLRREIPWNVHPQPQLRRAQWMTLNGTWDFAVSDKEPAVYDRKITVPFCPESALSGIGEHFPEGSGLYYRRSFTVPENFTLPRVLLHIGAADQKAEIYVNQKHIGSHAGGYESMCFDITDALNAENTLVIRAEDDLRSHVFPYGKQVMKRGGMWYTPVSGIWQSVWLENVADNYVNHLDIQVTQEAATITILPALDGTVTLDGKTYPVENGKAVIAPEAHRLWSPADPYLYRFTLQAGADRLESYFALRSLSTQVIDGIPRLCLNGKPYFFHGLLDQGYWPDGLFTPADPSCYEKDILTMKSLGFNTLRKHIKVEPEQFYYDCDRLGMIVFQDMVNNGSYSFLRDTALPTVGWQTRSDKRLHRDPATRQAFVDGMEATVHQLKNHPCICYWTIFNEGWGQFDCAPVYERLKELDSSRFIDTTSGWFRCGPTDVDSRHIYFGKWKLQPSDKPLVLSEFGGYVYKAEGHIFDPDHSYGYRTCKDRNAFMKDLVALYEEKVLPAMKKGLCAAIYTQVSDVEDEINGLMTYDREVVKPDPASMQAIAKKLVL